MDQQSLMELMQTLYPEGDQGMETIRGYKLWRGVPLGFLNGEDLLNQIDSIRFRPDDIIVHTYPKCGTIFIAELTRDLLEAAGKVKDDRKLMYVLETGINTDAINQAPEGIPRIIITHLPWDALPGELKQGLHKMICITRNPKDVFCSMYPFLKRMRYINERISMDQFLELYTTNKVPFGDYFEWHEQWLAHRSDSNLLSLRFEDMKTDLRGAVWEVVQHLDFEITEEQVELITQKNQFEAKKAAVKPGIAHQHLRKGKAGGWKEELTVEQISKLDAWIEEDINKLEGFDLRC